MRKMKLKLSSEVEALVVLFDRLGGLKGRHLAETLQMATEQCFTRDDGRHVQTVLLRIVEFDKGHGRSCIPALGKGNRHARGLVT